MSFYAIAALVFVAVALLLLLVCEGKSLWQESASHDDAGWTFGGSTDDDNSIFGNDD